MGAMRSAMLQTVDGTAVPEDEPAALRSASEDLAHRIRGYGSICTAKPNPYRAAEDAAELARPRVTADLDPAYQPKGQPPDGYALALAARQAVQDIQARRETVAPRALSATDDPDYNPRGTPPDPYRAGLARLRQESGR
jgi:hypothetical protein